MILMLSITNSASQFYQHTFSSCTLPIFLLNVLKTTELSVAFSCITKTNCQNVLSAISLKTKNNTHGFLDDVQGFLAMLRSYQATYEDTESEDTDTCSLWLTSGTTGMPKLVMKSHRSFTDACVVEGRLHISPLI